jgi:hypothetical protein
VPIPLRPHAHRTEDVDGFSQFSLQFIPIPWGQRDREERLDSLELALRPQKQLVIHILWITDRTVLVKTPYKAERSSDLLDDPEKSSTRTAESLEEPQAAMLFSARLHFRGPRGRPGFPVAAFCSLGEVLPSLPAPTVVGLPYL